MGEGYQESPGAFKRGLTSTTSVGLLQKRIFENFKRLQESLLRVFDGVTERISVICKEFMGDFRKIEMLL